MKKDRQMLNPWKDWQLMISMVVLKLVLSAELADIQYEFLKIDSSNLITLIT